MRCENYNGEMKISLEELDDRWGITEEKISEFEDRAIETKQKETKRKITKKINETYRESIRLGQLQELWYKCNRSQRRK